jgi:hypothetical protein
MSFKVTTYLPFGNATGIMVHENAGVPEVVFTPDPHGGPECLWFCFRVVRESQGGSDRLRLVLRHHDNMLGGGKAENIRPVVRQEGGDWERLGAGERHLMPDGRPLVTWITKAPAISLDVAFCYPYGLAEVGALVRESAGYWHSGSIGVSQGGRLLARLSNDPGKEGGERPGLYLVSRQHSGETPGSWMLDGFLRHAMTHPESAPLVWAVPLSNIDGVEAGDYGKDNFPYDLNRAWGDPPMRHEVLAIINDIGRWKKRCTPALALDFHAPGAGEGDGIYVYLPNPKVSPLEHSEAHRWAALAQGALAPEYDSANFAQDAMYPERWETPTFTRYCWDRLVLPALTLEVPYAIAKGRVLTRDDYRDAGVRLAAAIFRKVREGGRS